MIKIQVRNTAPVSDDVRGKFVLISRTVRPQQDGRVRVHLLNDDQTIGDSRTLFSADYLDQSTASEVFLWHRLSEGDTIHEDFAGLALCSAQILNARVLTDDQLAGEPVVQCLGCKEVMASGSKPRLGIAVIDTWENKK